jgi:hypothetical protein
MYLPLLSHLAAHMPLCPAPCLTAEILLVATCRCLSCCRSYLRERHQFGTPLASFQLMQEKLARMLGNVQVRGSGSSS